MFSELEELFLPVSESKSLSFIVKDTNVYLKADYFRLRQALANILDNAIKYTSSGKIVLSAYKDGNKVIIKIEDTGIGIPEKDIPKIFKKFYRIDKSRNSSGKGIGLSLARAYIEAHGGKISVKSKPGHGSTFYVIIPSSDDT